MVTRTIKMLSYSQPAFQVKGRCSLELTATNLQHIDLALLPGEVEAGGGRRRARVRALVLRRGGRQPRPAAAGAAILLYTSR